VSRWVFDDNERFESRIAKSPDGCWEWTGGTDGSGYGRLHYGEIRQPAHRVAFQRAVGPVPDGLYVCHHCDNKRCVRPDHLFAGTQKDNMQDWTKKGKNKLINDPSLLARGDKHWTRSDPLARKRIGDLRRAEWASGRRVAIRSERGRIMGTRMVP